MKELERMLTRRGASLIGYANLEELPPGSRKGFGAGISIAVALDPTIVAEIEEGPTVSYWIEYMGKNRLLDELAAAAADILGQAGHQAHAVPSTGVGIDWKRLATPQVPHKTVATRAGLGWIGKCALLVTREFGSAVRLATVLTDADLPFGTPVDDSRCGDCWACVEVCPAGAPSGRHWRAGLPREEFYDARACCENCRRMCRRRGIEATICGMCIAVCPWTQAYLEQGAGSG